MCVVPQHVSLLFSALRLYKTLLLSFSFASSSGSSDGVSSRFPFLGSLATRCRSVCVSWDADSCHVFIFFYFFSHAKTLDSKEMYEKNNLDLIVQILADALKWRKTNPGFLLAGNIVCS